MRGTRFYSYVSGYNRPVEEKRRHEHDAHRAKRRSSNLDRREPVKTIGTRTMLLQSSPFSPTHHSRTIIPFARITRPLATPTSDLRPPFPPQMPRDFLKDARDEYDVVVIGSGLAGLTAANVLARAGRSGAACSSSTTNSAAWPPGSNVPAATSSTSRCTAFPYGMIKSCRRYWTQEIADSIVQLKNIRFDNPMFSLTTTFNRDDFTRLLIERVQSRSRSRARPSSTPPAA